MRQRTALWIVGLVGALVFALLMSISCGGGEVEAEPTATEPAAVESPTPMVATVGDLEVTNAYAHGMIDTGIVYFTVKNTGDTDDALIEASTDVAGTTGLHETVTEEGMNKMQPVEEIAIPAGGEAILEPGGYHVMLTDVEKQLKVGDTIALTLTFKEAGSLDMQVTVTSYEEEMDDAME